VWVRISSSQVMRTMVKAPLTTAVVLGAFFLLWQVLVGGMLLGIPGALLAVPVAEIIRIVVTNLVAYRRTRRGTSEPEVSSPSEPTT
jgi:predicted PurR-regulated permease PerM